MPYFARAEGLLMSTPQPTATPRFWFIALLGILTGLDAVAIDMYLPAMPAMQQYFATDNGWIQATLAVFLLGLALGQLLYGPLTDRYGRRRPLLLGMLVFTLGSLLILFAPNIQLLLVGRLLQALGGAAALVIPRAIITDSYDGPTAARLYTFLMLAMGLGPIIAPPIGGLLFEAYGWHSIFAALTLFGVLCLGGIYYGIAESLPVPRRSKGSLLSSLRGYRQLLGQRQYLSYSLLGSCLTASMFTYISGAPFVLIELYGLSPSQFALLFASNAVGMSLLGLLNAYLLRHFSTRQLLDAGIALHLLLVAAFLIVSLLSTAFWSPLALLCASICSLGMFWGNGMALVMDGQREQAGRASALFGVLQYLLSGLSGVLLGLLNASTAQPMAALMLGLALASVGLRLLVEPNNRNPPALLKNQQKTQPFG
ncbi:MAG: multidrug effflux MFS transporter [Pseudomonas sp.]|uniref:multidrug effflux MFS transporter n=1 Tax=Pseudomonas sp. TaxID=306 RepID=UPI0039822CD8